MESEDLNPRSVPSRSPCVPLFCSPSVPEVSLMFNNSKWQNSQVFSPTKNMSRIPEHQKCLSANRYEQINAGVPGPENIQSFNPTKTDCNTQRIQIPKSYIYHGYDQQLEKFHHSSGLTRDSNYRNKCIGKTFENTNKYQNIYTDTDTSHNSEQQIKYANRKDQFAMNSQENTSQGREHFQHIPGREIDKMNSREIEHYKGWKTYFQDQISGDQCSIHTSVRVGNSFKDSPQEKRCLLNPITSSQNQHSTPLSIVNKESHMPGNNTEEKNTVMEITESQLQNIVLNIISNLENSPHNSKEATSASHTSSQREVQIVNNGQKIPMSSLVDKEVSSNEKQKSQHCINSRFIEERNLELGLSPPEIQNLHLASGKNKIHGTGYDKGEKTGKTHHSEIADEEKCNQRCDCHISFTKLYKVLKSQASHLQVLQEKVDKIILQQENNLRISESLSKREQSELSSKKRPKRMVHVSTQTVDLFHREIAVSTDCQETASVGVMTETYDDPQHGKKDPTFSFEREQILHDESFEELGRPRYEQTISEDMHHQDSICLNSLELPSMQVQAPSPMPSIHVDMQDFEEDENDSNSESSHYSNSNGDAQQPARAGWTFYDNVVDQVNKLLQDPSNGRVENRNMKYVMNKDRTSKDRLRDVRKATMEQLKKMGISFHGDIDHDIHTRKPAQHFDPVCHPNLQVPFKNESTDPNRSVQINAMAMKYLKDENYSEAQVCNISMKATNFSLATLRYLERYHLLPPCFYQDSCGETSSNQQIQARAAHNTRNGSNFDKILDVTTIKNQPKLL